MKVLMHRFNGSSWQPIYPQTTIDQVKELPTRLEWIERDIYEVSSWVNNLSKRVDDIEDASGWTLLYNGSTMLSSSSFSTINLSDSINIGDVLAIEVRYGSNSTSYNSRIILTAIGSNSYTSTSGINPRKIGVTDFDGEYFKNIYFITYRYSTTQLRVGHYSYLRGRFLPSSNTVDWNTNQSLSVYITRIWKVT